MGVADSCRNVVNVGKTCFSVPSSTPDFDDNENDLEYDSNHNPILFNTKLERIIYKLKFLRGRADKYGDKESLKHISWILNTIHDRDLHEPINRPKQMDKEALEIIGTYSQQYKYSEQINDAKQVIKAEKIKNIRKSPGYQKFIAKFKKKIGNIVKDISNTPTTSLTEIPKNIVEQVKQELNRIDTFEFNIFDLDRLIQKKCLFYTLNQVLNKYGFIKELLIEKKYINFVNEITSGYNRKVPYHNDMHATDVLQTVHIIIEKGKLAEKIQVADVDILATLIGAACHDFRHNGYNNGYHMNVYSDIAVNYNDVSVLENMHVCETFKIIFKEGNNLFEKLSPEQFRTLRRRMIECILATDMANHGKKLNEMKAKFDTLDIKAGVNIKKLIIPGDAKESILKNSEMQGMILGSCVHTADLSNPAKLNKIFIKWTDLVYSEFFSQGEKEKELGMNVSMLCDRQTTNIHKSQIGFIKFVVIPQFEMMINIVPEINTYLDNIKMNLKYSEDESVRGETKK